MPPLQLGSKAPDFSLPGVDGKDYSLSSFAQARALIVVFSCNHCPYVKAYEQRLVDLQDKYGPTGAQIVCINSNDDYNYPEDSFAEMKIRAQTAKFNFPYLRDQSQTVAKAYGAERTPHLFGFGPERALAYLGGIDDNWQHPESVRERYLADAIEDILAGRPMRRAESPAIGCTIKWKGNF